MKRIRDLKRNAKQALRGNYGILIMASVATAGLGLLGSMLTMALFPGYGITDMILSQVFSVILSLVLSVITAGFSYMILSVARGNGCSMGDLFHFFKSHPDRVIVATIVLAVINVLATIPVTYYNFTVSVGSSLEAQMEWLVNYGMLILVTSILNVVLSIPFAMIYFLLADNSEMSGMEAVKASARMMKGKIGKYILVQISFIPLLFLSVFTLYIALLWIMPYMEMTNAMFYRDILGEFDVLQQVETVPSYYQIVQQNNEVPQDEDNSEA